ncbi:hypothetical protein GCM10009816_06910 [Microbacterium aquimaris]
MSAAGSESDEPEQAVRASADTAMPASAAEMRPRREERKVMCVLSSDAGGASGNGVVNQDGSRSTCDGRYGM